jgi:hypothetical protein
VSSSTNTKTTNINITVNRPANTNATTKSSLVTQEQRQEFANKFLQQLHGSGSTLGLEQASKIQQAILNGDKDEDVWKHLQKQTIEAVQRDVPQLPAPRRQLALPAPEQDVQSATSSQQQSAQTAPQQNAQYADQKPLRSTLSAVQEQVHTSPALYDQSTMASSQRIERPSPHPVQPHPQSGHALLAQTTTTTTTTTTASGQQYYGQGSLPGHNQLLQNFGHQQALKPRSLSTPYVPNQLEYQASSQLTAPANQMSTPMNWYGLQGAIYQQLPSQMQQAQMQQGQLQQSQLQQGRMRQGQMPSEVKALQNQANSSLPQYQWTSSQQGHVMPQQPLQQLPDLSKLQLTTNSAQGQDLQQLTQMQHQHQQAQRRLMQMQQNQTQYHQQQNQHSQILPQQNQAKYHGQQAYHQPISLQQGQAPLPNNQTMQASPGQQQLQYLQNSGQQLADQGHPQATPSYQQGQLTYPLMHQPDASQQELVQATSQMLLTKEKKHKKHKHKREGNAVQLQLEQA